MHLVNQRKKMFTTKENEEYCKQLLNDFHNTHTHLRVVSKKANLSVLKRKSITAVTTCEGREVSLW